MIHGRTKLNPCADNIAAFSLEFCVVNSNFHTRIGVAYVRQKEIVKKVFHRIYKVLFSFGTKSIFFMHVVFMINTAVFFTFQFSSLPNQYE